MTSNLKAVDYSHTRSRPGRLPWHGEHTPPQRPSPPPSSGAAGAQHGQALGTGWVYITIFLHPAQEGLPSLCHMEGSHPDQLLGPHFIDSETERGHLVTVTKHWNPDGLIPTTGHS